MDDYNTKIDNHRFFHVAIARLMEMTNIFQKSDDPNLLGIGYPILIRALYPFAPHLTSDLWFSLYDELEGADGERYNITANNA